jgi:hypothetical protein
MYNWQMYCSSPYFLATPTVFKKGDDLMSTAAPLNDTNIQSTVLTLCCAKLALSQYRTMGIRLAKQKTIYQDMPTFCFASGPFFK